ncbi:Hypothetical predicted protein [Cloeon dipterum]|uniref:Methyltransferase-like protein 4 n=2 Tax=Cloeon dipterum TaxID=197152 RepID=A0A8S1CQU4_9INSE|nr:Hypothetical predicted protein [Cloeon dipterum]
MSVVAACDEGYFLSHKDFIVKTYQEINSVPAEPMFDLRTPFMQEAQSSQIAARMLDPDGQPPKKKSKKEFIFRKAETDSNQLEKMSEVTLVKERMKAVLESARNCGCLNYSSTPEDFKDNNSSSRKFSDSVFQVSNIIGSENSFSGANNSDCAMKQSIQEENYVLPSECRFFCGDLFSLENFLREEKFDLLVIDPPWWNKYIRRRKLADQASSYSMMNNKDLAQIPIEKHLAPGALVAIWCTNSQSNINQLRDDVMPSWGLEYISTWFWVKVTKSGCTVCDFSVPPGKQPYERILFGRSPSAESSKNIKNPDENKVILSVPSAIHSHKPPLIDVLAPFVQPSPKILELFARSLLPNTTSCGLEVLKLQHEILFKSNERR